MKRTPKIIATANGSSVEIRHEDFDVGEHHNLMVAHVLAAALCAIAFGHFSIKQPVVGTDSVVTLHFYSNEAWASTAEGVAHAINNTPSLALYVQAAVAVLGGVR